jgi:DNA-binding beta-propeller fold protein YncE
MNRRLLPLSMLLATLSLAAGLVDPVDPFVANRLFVADGGAIVHEFDETGAALGTYSAGPSQLTGLVSAHDLAFGPEGALYVSDFDQDRVLVFDSVGGVELARVGAGSGLSGPTDMVFGPFGDLFVASSGSHLVLRFDRNGGLAGTLGGGSGLADPRGLAFSSDGHLFVSSRGSHEVLEFDPAGSLVSVLGAASGISSPYGLAISARTGQLFVANQGTDEVLVFDGGGAQVTSFGASEGLLSPTGLSFGPDGLLYVASSGGGEVLVFNHDGLVDRLVGTVSLGAPSGLAFSPFVLGASVKGRIQVSGSNPVKFRRPARLNWAPGSGQVSLLLVDDPSADDPFFGSETMVAHGFESAPALPGPGVSFAGRELDTSALLGSVGSLGFASRGMAVNLTGIQSLTGLYSPNRFEGRVHKTVPGKISDAKIRQIDKLPK